MQEKTVSRGLHGISIGSIIAAIAVLISNPEKAESFLWYVNHRDHVQKNVSDVPHLQSLVFDLRVRMDRMEADNDSLTALIESLQRATHVIAAGKSPFDSVRVTLSSGERKSFHVNTHWIWRQRE